MNECYIWMIWTGVAVGSGWQSYVAYINLGCYYIIGVPLGFLMGWFFKLGVMVCLVSRHLCSYLPRMCEFHMY